MFKGQDLQKALEALDVLSKTFSRMNNGDRQADLLPEQDLFCYDNASMMKKLKVSERTLQRYRKQGRIRSITFGGTVYYPKNFIITPIREAETQPDEKDNVMPLNEFIKRYNKPKPRSKIIDVDRLAKRLTYFPRAEKTYNQDDVAKLLQRTQIKRKKNHAYLKLWPKKIKLINLPPETHDILHFKK